MIRANCGTHIFLMGSACQIFMTECRSCGKGVDDSHVFCPYCGADDPIPSDPSCPNCAVDVDVDWVRCPSCGESLQTTQEDEGMQMPQQGQVPQSVPMGAQMHNLGGGVASQTFNQATMVAHQPMMGHAQYATDGAFGRPAFAMSFGGALKTCFMDKFANFSGRASRSEFWWCYLAFSLIGMVLWGVWFGMFLLFDLMMDDVTAAIVCCIVGSFAYIGVSIPYLAVSVRRLHDVGYSGWWMLISFVPMGGIILLVWFLTDGQPVTNMYGQVPTNIREPPITGVTFPVA